MNPTRSLKLLELCRIKNNIFAGTDSELMPVFVRNETKSVKDDYNFGFPSEDTLNKMKEKILVLKIKEKGEVYNENNSLIEIKTDRPIEKHEEEEKEKCAKRDLTKEWLKTHNFIYAPSPEYDPELHQKEYTELLPLENQSVMTSVVCNSTEETESFVIENQNCGNDFKSTSSRHSTEIKILQNIVVLPPVVKNDDNSLISDKTNSQTRDVFATDDDDSLDRDYEPESSSTAESASSDYKIQNKKLKPVGTQGTIFEVDIREEPASLANQIKKNNDSRKKTVRCKFCSEDVLSKNFMRHLQRHHGSEKEVTDILMLPKNSKERRLAVILLRKDTNFDLHISGTTRPYRHSDKSTNNKFDYYPCIYCKGIFRRIYLKRHAKVCIRKPETEEKAGIRMNYISKSQTIVACASDPTDTISKLNVKHQVFDKMKADEISFVVKKDLLIAQIGETYLKKHKREQMIYVCSNRMRELGRLLICYRNQVNKTNVSLKELLNPKNFDLVLSTARTIVGYDPIKKTFRSPSLAMHLGTSLKLACDELSHLIVKECHGFKTQTEIQKVNWLKNVKNFKKLVESRWNCELASLANKDLQEKRWNKPLLLPLVNDIKMFRDECLKIADNCSRLLTEQKDDIATYKLFNNCVLALLIVFNRRRIGDVQFLKIADYKKDQRSNVTDFESALTETEKVLTTKYRRVLNSGKGSRAVVILIPEILQNYINLLLNNRHKYIPPENEYVFAVPGSTIAWGKGDVAIRSLASKMKLENYHTLTSNKLRKHVATVMQILNLSKDETKQFSQFMGHTEKTHQEFYELPVDIYQTAKVSKILLMMEKGTIPVQFKGRSLAEINLDADLEYAEENDDDEDGVVQLEENIHATLEESEECINVGQEKKEVNANRESDDDLFDSCKNGNYKNKNGSSNANKRGWTAKEVGALGKRFASCIKNRTYPSGKEIEDFLKEHNMNRSVAVTKSKLQHLIKLSLKT